MNIDGVYMLAMTEAPGQRRLVVEKLEVDSMIPVLRALVVLLGCLFILGGIGWYVDPARPAERLGMVLMDGVGRSSQIGDLSALFVTAGACVLIGAITRNRTWFYPTVMMMGVAAIGRLLAWLLHDAALAMDLIAVEAGCAALFLLASDKLADTEN